MVQMTRTYEDCRAVLSADGELLIGNSRIERRFLADESGLTPLSLSGSGTVWQRPEQTRRLPLPFGQGRLETAMYEDDNHGLSERFLAVRLCWRGESGGSFARTLTIFPGTPFVTMSISAEGLGVYPSGGQMRTASGDEAGNALTPAAQDDCVDTVTLPRGHYKLYRTFLSDRSDLNDALVRTSCQQVYAGGWGCEWSEGSAFLLDDYVRDRALLLVKDAPFPMSALNRTRGDLVIEQGACASLVGTGLPGEDTADGVWGYGSAVGVGRREELPALYRAFYKKVWRQSAPRIMSNTWGDRSRDAAVCHDFMIKEINRAAFLGVDIVQIDDGWQQGHTINSALKKGGVWEGYYSADPDFWSVSRDKFPQGLGPLAEHARACGIELGLWFSPDSGDDFARWRRDADTLLQLWRREGVRHFKLDGVNLRTKRGERNYLKLLEAVSVESGGAIAVYQDLTAQNRLGSLYFKQYGRLFVENRYTDTAGYYPHATLKNLWTMSRLIPPARLQMEVLNPRRNTALYEPGDLFAPDTYEMDYLFAAVMLSSPLLWMEMSRLSDRDACRLREIIAVYRTHRDAMADCDVCPIGDEPDGQSLTGFLLTGRGSGYLLLFRETTGEDRFLLPSLPDSARLQLLISNGPVQLEEKTVRLGQQRQYALLRWTT